MNKPNSGVIEIHGKQYETVALRVQKFRAAHGFELSLVTDIVHRDESCVVMRATIRQGETILATGHAEEYRENTGINRTSALENCETSAIGRALATLGLGGTEFATADELKRAIVDKQPAKVTNPLTEMKESAFNSMPAAEQEFLRKTAADVSALLEEGRDAEAHGFLENQNLDTEEKLAIWFLFNSKQRAALKAAGAAAHAQKRAEDKARQGAH